VRISECITFLLRSDDLAVHALCFRRFHLVPIRRRRRKRP